jgi:hypothetical protein
MNTRVETRVGSHTDVTKVGSKVGYALSLITLAFGGVLTLLWSGFLVWVLARAGWRLFF